MTYDKVYTVQCTFKSSALCSPIYKPEILEMKRLMFVVINEFFDLQRYNFNRKTS